MVKSQPWSPADATDELRKLAVHGRLTLSYSGHAKERMIERELFVGDILHVLKHGFVYERPVEANRPGFYKYQIVGKTPNSGARLVGVVAVPDVTKIGIAIITVLWVSE